MQVVGNETVLLDPFAFRIVDHKLFLESVSFRRFVVGLRDILDRHRLGAVVLAYPVRIRQVDADRRCRVTVASKHCHGDHFRGDTFYFFFLKTLVHRRMVLEPLRVFADDFCTLRRFPIDEVRNRLPACFHAQRVAVCLRKAVDKVYFRRKVFHPEDGIGIERFEVACTVIFDQLLDNGSLCVILGKGHGLLQLVDDAFNRLRIQSAYFPDLFNELAVYLSQPTVEAVGDSHRIVRVTHAGIEIFRFFLCDAALIVIICRSQKDIAFTALYGPFGHHLRIEDDRRDFFKPLLHALSLAKR